MSILGGVEKIHNNLNTYITEDIKVFKFSMSEWSAIINDDDYSLLEPIRDWRALGKSPIIEIPDAAIGMSGGRSIGFVYLPLIVVSQSSEYTIFAFETIGENVVVSATMACQGTNVINFSIHTTKLPIISGNTVDGELLTIDGAELKTSGISVSDLEDLHDDVNTKTFYLSGTSDLTNAQAAYDWYKAGKNPIIRISGWNYSFILEGNNSEPTYHLGFYGVNGGANDGISNSSIGINPRLELRYSSNTVTSVVVSGDNAHVLFTDVNYSTPYTPAYNGSPATKKYVDDTVADNALPIDIPIPAAELAPVAADLFDYFQAHNGVGYPLINVNGKLYEYSGWTTDDDIITLEYASTSVEEGYLYRIDHVDKIRKYRFIYTDGEFTRVDTDVSWYFGGELANGCPLWVVNSSSEASVITGTFGDMARFINQYGINKSMGIVYDGWYYLKIHTYSTDGNYRKIIFIRLYPITSNYNSGYSRTYRPTIYLYFTYDSGTGYTYDHYDDSYIIVESPQVLATNVNYSTPYTPQYDGSPATKKYVDDSVSSAISAGTTAPSNPIEGMLWYDTTNDVLKVYDGTQRNAVDTDTTYNAGEGIKIGTYDDYSAMRGPCPEGFHVPSQNEWVALCGILTTTFGLSNNMTTLNTYLKMPSHGYRSEANGSIAGSTSLYYWSSTRNADYAAGSVYATSSAINLGRFNARARGFNVRGFRDKPIIPDGSWVTLYDGSSVSVGAGIFHNLTLGLISVSGDGINWTTIADKNLGASTVYNNGDTVTDSNCGGYFQWGNNYMFPFSGSVTTSSTKVDATGYGPGNYYSSDIFITPSDSPKRRENPENKNLRGGETGVVAINNAIINTGVISVNGQTGNIIMSEPTVISGDSGTTYTIKVSNSAPASGTPNSTITFIV